MATQIRGSQRITPLYPAQGIIKTTKTIFPISSIKLETKRKDLLPQALQAIAINQQEAQNGIKG